MKSDKAGTTTLDNKTEVTNISSHGIWLFHDGEEHFMSYESFPWFKKASIEEVLNVEVLTPDHFYWPDIDVDLHLDSIKHPKKYPLVSK